MSPLGGRGMRVQTGIRAGDSTVAILDRGGTHGAA